MHGRCALPRGAADRTRTTPCSAGSEGHSDVGIGEDAGPNRWSASARSHTGRRVRGARRGRHRGWDHNSDREPRRRPGRKRVAPDCVRDRAFPRPERSWGIAVPRPSGSQSARDYQWARSSVSVTMSRPSTRLWGAALGHREGGDALVRSADAAAVRLIVVGDRDPPCPGKRANTPPRFGCMIMATRGASAQVGLSPTPGSLRLAICLPYQRVSTGTNNSLHSSPILTGLRADLNVGPTCAVPFPLLTPSARSR